MAKIKLIESLRGGGGQGNIHVDKTQIKGVFKILKHLPFAKGGGGGGSTPKTHPLTHQ